MHIAGDKREYSLKEALENLKKEGKADKIVDHTVVFVALVSVEGANPNGSPDDGLPRVKRNGIGFMSDGCIKRKLRNRLQDMGEPILYKMDYRADDGYKGLQERLDGNENMKALAKSKTASDRDYRSVSCREWTDVRLFGEVIPSKGSNAIGVKGPVSINEVRSFDPVRIEEVSITKSMNAKATKDGKRAPDTMGSKAYVEYGLYAVRGGITAIDARETGITYADVEKLKYALMTMFEGDASAARPIGSMEVTDLVWYDETGGYNPHKLHKTVTASAKTDYLTCYEDYDVSINVPEGLTPEIYKC